MKKFSFSLQPVLDYRKTIEEALKREFSASQSVLQEDMRHLEVLVDKKDDCQDELAKKRTKDMGIQELSEYQNYLDLIMQNIRGQKVKIQADLKEIDEKRTQLTEASKKKKVLERLREKHLLLFMKTLDKWEQHFLDEISRNRYISEKL